MEQPNRFIYSQSTCLLHATDNDVDVDVVCRRRLKASLPASKIQY